METDKNRLPAKRNSKGIDFRKYTTQIAKFQEQAGNTPQTFTEKIRASFVEMIPIASLRESLKQRPLDTAAQSMRATIYDLYGNMSNEIKEGKALVDEYTGLRELLDEVIAAPDDLDMLTALRDKMREKAEQDLNLQRDEETEILLEEIINPSDPARRAQLRDETIKRAEQRLSIFRDTAKIGENLTINTARQFEDMNNLYALILNIKKSVAISNKTGEDAIKAQELRVNAFNSMVEQMHLLVNTASLVTEVNKNAREIWSADDDAQIRAISKSVEDLSKKTLAILPPATDSTVKQLPPTNPS